MWVRSALVALDQPLFRHDLEQLQRGRVGGRALAAEDVVHLPDGAGAAVPQDAQDRQLGVGRSGGGGSRPWADAVSTNTLRSVNEDLRSCYEPVPVWQLDGERPHFVDRIGIIVVARAKEMTCSQVRTRNSTLRKAPSRSASSTRRRPTTVANFVGLAEGTKEWRDPATGERRRRRSTTASSSTASSTAS